MPPRQIMLVSWTKCKKVALCYQGKLRLCRGRNVRRRFCITKANRVCAADGMFDVGFVAKASSLMPRPSLLYLEAQLSGRKVSWVDKEATHSVMSLKLIWKLELAGA
jgi:hypothetical protein